MFNHTKIFFGIMRKEYKTNWDLQHLKRNFNTCCVTDPVHSYIHVYVSFWEKTHLFVRWTNLRWLQWNKQAKQSYEAWQKAEDSWCFGGLGINLFLVGQGILSCCGETTAIGIALLKAYAGSLAWLWYVGVYYKDSSTALWQDYQFYSFHLSLL